MPSRYRSQGALERRTWYRTSHSKPDQKFVEVHEVLAPRVKKIAKALDVTLKNETLLDWHAHNAAITNNAARDIIGEAAFRSNRSALRAGNAAKHDSYLAASSGQRHSKEPLQTEIEVESSLGAESSSYIAEKIRNTPRVIIGDEVNKPKHETTESPHIDSTKNDSVTVTAAASNGFVGGQISNQEKRNYTRKVKTEKRRVSNTACRFFKRGTCGMGSECKIAHSPEVASADSPQLTPPATDWPFARVAGS